MAGEIKNWTVIFLIEPMQNAPCGKWQNIECWVLSGKWRWGFCPYSREVSKVGWPHKQHLLLPQQQNETAGWQQKLFKFAEKEPPFQLFLFEPNWCTQLCFSLLETDFALEFKFTESKSSLTYGIFSKGYPLCQRLPSQGWSRSHWEPRPSLQAVVTHFSILCG